jgi:hypothetical protein
MKDEELALEKKQEELASTLLAHSATYLLAVQLDKFLDKVVSQALRESDQELASAWRISHLIRNAFAHDPLAPTWDIKQNLRNQLFRVRDIISLDTTELHGKPVLRHHYGGPLALLRLVQYIRSHE